MSWLPLPRVLLSLADYLPHPTVCHLCLVVSPSLVYVISVLPCTPARLSCIFVLSFPAGFTSKLLVYDLPCVFWILAFLSSPFGIVAGLIVFSDFDLLPVLLVVPHNKPFFFDLIELKTYIPAFLLCIYFLHTRWENLKCEQKTKSWEMLACWVKAHSESCLVYPTKKIM